MSGEAVCACLRVEYQPEEHEGGTLSDRWVCPLCGREFCPSATAEAALAEAQARVEELEGAIREAMKTAGRRWSEWGGRAESVEKILDDAIMAAVEQAEEGK